jgi:hypothetical protein
MRGRIRRTVYTCFVFSLYVAYVLTFTSLMYGVGIVNGAVTKNLPILTFNWAGSWAKFSLVACLSQNADIFFLTSVFIYSSFA